ncbi:unnamed protein product [Periconia digitata]|uniref:ER-bound oxygenase mpaB/mpaB'/Rubber oxygenase catalytic domain-containing protein n=1 Tax=Periconia digitata TaxID=1303443 RepID=A0A9W4U228_9PLEO|nr:unnamed protein product [Periconia digitata]
MQHLIRHLSSRLSSGVGIGLAAFAGYVILCRTLRFLRRNRKHAHFPYKTRKDFSNMTADDAWQIVRYCMSLEFPLVSEKALEFALFRTYGIPTISKLLCQTQQLSEQKYASRRYADTNILIGEFLAHGPTSERANAAISRMNYIHGRYQNAGKISNDDMLYTLALFILEIERWVRLYEWRCLTPMEICAFGTHWKSIGDAMGIDFGDLAHGPNSFQDGYEFFEDIKQWSEGYEKKCMVPNGDNHKLAEETTRILLADIPNIAFPYAKPFVAVLMDDRLREAMLYDKPPAVYARILFSLLKVRKFLVRNFALPRPYCLRYSVMTDDPDSNGRYYRTKYASEPWYIKPTFWARIEPRSWVRWAAGSAYPDGKRYKPEGYSMFEVGPANMEDKGQKECAATLEQLMSSSRGACPFASGKAR